VPGWIGWLALAAFGLRALVPLGFDLGTHTLSIVLCHEGFPSGFFGQGEGHHGTGGAGSGSSSHCLFCSSTSSAPAYRLASLTHRAPFTVALVPSDLPAPALVRCAHVPQARAPPASV
jgi:hypothetical protein